jgi:hypothetical protein
VTLANFLFGPDEGLGLDESVDVLAKERSWATEEKDAVQ